MNPLPVQRARQLASHGPQTPWLVEELWTEQAVGILGGEPKCCNSFLALEVAVSVAYQLKLPLPLSRPIDPQGNGNGKHSDFGQ